MISVFLIKVKKKKKKLLFRNDCITELAAGSQVYFCCCLNFTPLNLAKREIVLNCLLIVFRTLCSSVDTVWYRLRTRRPWRTAECEGPISVLIIDEYLYERLQCLAFQTYYRLSFKFAALISFSC